MKQNGRDTPLNGEVNSEENAYPMYDYYDKIFALSEKLLRTNKS